MKFLALLGTCLCVSGALAQAPSDVLVDEFTITFNAYFEHTTPVLEAGQTYFMTIDGHYNISSGTYGHKDAAWYYCYSGCSEGCNVNTPCPSMDSDHWNASITSLRPDTDVYDANHHYEYTFEGDGSAMVFDFGDSAYGDNGGSLAVSIYLMPTPVPGCTDVAACNYNPEATEDDGSCVEPLVGDDCNAGSAACGDGQVWNPETQTCLTLTMFDSNFDGCITNSDLIDFLAVYGLCMEAESTGFAECGDPVSYQGYDYTTVLIGDQCWFGENLRVGNYRNGDAIAQGLDGASWLTTEVGATAVYGDDGFGCFSYVPGENACDETYSFGEFGRQYNGHSVTDSRGLCPTGWSVPSDENWIEMELFVGLNPLLANEVGYRGEEIGGLLKSNGGWAANNGSDAFGFEGKAGGKIQSSDGYCDDAGRHGAWWTSTVEGEGMYMRLLAYNNAGILRTTQYMTAGFSVRCVKDQTE